MTTHAVSYLEPLMAVVGTVLSIVGDEVLPHHDLHDSRGVRRKKRLSRIMWLRV